MFITIVEFQGDIKMAADKERIDKANEKADKSIEEMKDKIYEDYIYMHADIKSPYSIKVMLDNDAEIIKKDQTGYYTKIKIRW